MRTTVIAILVGALCACAAEENFTRVPDGTHDEYISIVDTGVEGDCPGIEAKQGYVFKMHGPHITIWERQPDGAEVAVRGAGGGVRGFDCLCMDGSSAYCYVEMTPTTVECQDCTGSLKPRCLAAEIMVIN